MKAVVKIVLSTITLLSTFTIGFTWRDLARGERPNTGAFGKLLGLKGSEQEPEAVFKQSYNGILNNYYRSVKPTELRYAGMAGMMASLGDPHTLFFPPRAAKAFSDDTKANFVGVGARLSPDVRGAKIVNVFEQGPAEKAGIKSGDIIVAVDGKSTAGLEIDDIVSRVKGLESTVVRLSILRAPSTKPIQISVNRGKVIAPTVDGKVFPESKMGYLSITSFAEPTASQYEKELAKLEQQGIKGLVIDLRSNPGGILDTATEMLGRYLDGKLVVKMKFRNGREVTETTDKGGVANTTYPIAILMDENSASAAEIFAGCMHDYGKATLVGTHSYGKASVQHVESLIDAASAKITIAKYFLPRSGYIGRKVDDFGAFLSGGLEPDIRVELSLDAEFLGDPKTDNQLAKAIQFLQTKS